MNTQVAMAYSKTYTFTFTLLTTINWKREIVQEWRNKQVKKWVVSYGISLDISIRRRYSVRRTSGCKKWVWDRVPPSGCCSSFLPRRMSDPTEIPTLHSSHWYNGCSNGSRPPNTRAHTHWQLTLWLSPVNWMGSNPSVGLHVCAWARPWGLF